MIRVKTRPDLSKRRYLGGLVCVLIRRIPRRVAERSLSRVLRRPSWKLKRATAIIPARSAKRGQVCFWLVLKIDWEESEMKWPWESRLRLGACFLAKRERRWISFSENVGLRLATGFTLRNWREESSLRSEDFGWRW